MGFGTLMVATVLGNLMPVLTAMRFCMHMVNTQANTHAHNFLKLHSINVSRATERPEVQTSERKHESLIKHIKISYLKCILFNVFIYVWVFSVSERVRAYTQARTYVQRPDLVLTIIPEELLTLCFEAGSLV